MLQVPTTVDFLQIRELNISKARAFRVILFDLFPLNANVSRKKNHANGLPTTRSPLRKLRL